MATDGDLARALNALTTTLNDQKATEFDVDRLQAIVTGALSGEGKLRVRRGSPAGGFIEDEDGEQVAELLLEGGGWRVSRRRGTRSSRAYIPSAG